MREKYTFDEVHDGQQMFRLLLRAFANPLQRVDIRPFADKLYGGHKDQLALAVTLMDNECTFCSFGSRLLDESIISLTLSRPAGPETADYIYVWNRETLGKAVAAAKCGTLADPQKSATLLIALPEGEKERMTFTGPGIDGRITVTASGTVREAVRLRDGRGMEYPQGLDFVFLEPDGHVFALPRLVKEEAE